MPVSSRLGRGEIEHILRDAPVRVLVFDEAHREGALAALAAAGTDCLPVVLDAPASTDGTEDDLLPYDALLAEGDPEPVAVETAEDAPAVLNFTSGSTGSLKAPVQTFGNRWNAPTPASRSSRPGPRVPSRLFGMGVS